MSSGATKSDKKPLKDLVKEKNEKNPTMLGDPTSLKAETSNLQPTEDDMPNKSPAARATEKGTSEQQEESNPSQLGDPVSLKAEGSKTEPTEQDRGASETGKSDQSGKSKL